MTAPKPAALSRRERQIMDIVHHDGSVTAARVQEALPDPPSYSAVRSLLSVLVRKGHLRHHRDGNHYVFEPTQSAQRARKTALRHLVETFFGGSREDAMAALLELPRGGTDNAELARLAALIRDARKEGR